MFIFLFKLKKILPASLLLLWLTSCEPKLPEKPAPQEHPPHYTLSDLANPPQWNTLKAFHHTLTKKEFKYLLKNLYTTDSTWKKWIHFDKNKVFFSTHSLDSRFTLSLSLASQIHDKQAPPRSWKMLQELPPAPQGLPLQGYRIALDPGHIGGLYAKMEERWFTFEHGMPVMEGAMTLLVAKHLQKSLEALGAQVFLLRKHNAPINPHSPRFYYAQARKLSSSKNPQYLRKLAEKLFYRTGEIRARASKLASLDADLVLCLHFNAESWQDPNHPTFVTHNHYHVLTFGALTSREFLYDDQRYEMLLKLLNGSAFVEEEIGSAIAHSLEKHTHLPPYIYQNASHRVRKVSTHPALWARNLLANRLYSQPTLFLEPYVMNHKDTYLRVQAGDYDGLKPINQQAPRPSIYREYAAAVTQALLRYATMHRKLF